MSDTTLTTFRVENGPFDDGPDTIYVDVIGKDAAKQLAKRVDDFTPVSYEEVDEAPEDAILYRTDRPDWLESESLSEARIR